MLISLLGVFPPPAICWALPSLPLRPLTLGTRGRFGGGSLPLPFRPCYPSHLRSLGCRPPLPSAGLYRTPVPASLSLGLPPTRPEPRRGSVLTSTWRFCLSHLLGLRNPRQQGLPPPRPKPHRWGVLPGAPSPWLLSLSLPPPPLSPLPSRPVAPLRHRHQTPAPGVVGWGVGSSPLPPVRVHPPPAGIVTLWGLPEFCIPRGPHSHLVSLRRGLSRGVGLF